MTAVRTELTNLARWRYALKPASWPKLLVPAAFGLSLGFADARRFDARAAAYALAFTIFDIAFVVLLNDYADREVDAIKRRMFPSGCSKKTIPDGILPAHALLLAGGAAGALALVTAMAASFHLGRPLAPAMALLCLGLFVAYTLPPLRLNYRGGGELLEALGVGVALPMFGAYLESGRVIPSLAPLLPGYALLSFSSAVASGLSDEESDRRGGKRTFTTLLGNPAARRIVEGAVLTGALAWILPLFMRWVPVPGWMALPAFVVIAHAAMGMRRTSAAATTGAFGAQAEYKRALHEALWTGTLIFSAAIAADRILAT